MAEKRRPRKKGQHTSSSSHDDLFTNENPEGDIKGLGFKDAATAKKGVTIVNKAKRTHAHKVQATLVMVQRGKEVIKRTKDPDKKRDLKAANKIWSAHLEKLKEKTKKMNENNLRQYVRNLLIEWELANDRNLMLDREGMEKSDRENVSQYLKSLGLLESRSLLGEKSYGKSSGDNRLINVDNMRIRVEIDDIDYRATKHSQERQSRHKKPGGGGFGISSRSIRSAIEAAIGMIINDYANGELKNGERFLIVARTGPGIPLNIVGVLNMQKGPDDFGVITVMRKEDFKSELPRYEVSV